MSYFMMTFPEMAIYIVIVRNLILFLNVIKPKPLFLRQIASIIVCYGKGVGQNDCLVNVAYIEMLC